MELTNYLYANFVTREALLKQTGVDEANLNSLQENRCMPRCSYRIDGSLNCYSPIAETEAKGSTEFYATGYIDWLKEVVFHGDPSAAYQEFTSRFTGQMNSLLKGVLRNYNPPWLDNIDDHIQKEWQHFLEGTYGVCTKTGLPEDIASKELTAARIVELVADEELEPSSQTELIELVALLDSVCSEFAPHERDGSSRQRLINEVRAKYPIFDLESSVQV